MNQKEVYARGVDTGYEIALENAADMLAEGMTPEEVEAECINHEQDVFRQYSPFEFFAKEINETGCKEVYSANGNLLGMTEPDEWRVSRLWEEYDRGVAVGIRKAVRGAVAAIKEMKSDEAYN